MLTESEGLKYLANKARIKLLEAQNEELLRAANVRDAPIGSYPDGKIVVEVSRNARFDPALATELYPLGPNNENIELYSAKVDSTLAKQHLTPEQYEAAQKVFPANKVEVKLT